MNFIFIKNRSVFKKRFSSFQLFAAALFVNLLFVGSVSAQTGLTGGLRGVVTDANGAAVVGASVRIKNKPLVIKQETVTDGDGRYTILRLTPDNNYEIEIAASGFKTFERSGVSVISGETNLLDASLEVAAASATVEVNASEQPVQSPEISQVISERQLKELPIYNRGVQRAALLDPHVRNTSPLGGDASNATRLSINGRIFRETHYELDGNNNTDFVFNNAPLQTVSLSAVQEFKVLTNQYAAEHGGTTAGFVILTTKSGTNRFSGETFFLGRPSGIQARPPLADRRIPNEQFQYGASVGGPIVTDKAFFYFDYQGTRQNRGSFVDRPAPQVFVGKLRENLGLFKLDYRFTNNHTAGFRLNAARYTNTNPNDRITFLAQSSQPIQPSAAALTILQNVGTQFNDTYAKNNFVNEFRASYTNALPSTSRPLAPQVVIIRAGVSTEGNASFSDYRLQNTEFGDIISLQLKKHSFKFGGEYTRQMLHEVSFQQFGTYNLNTAGAIVSFTQQIGVNDLRSGQTRTALFVQDDFRATNKLTLNFGLRYDYQSIIGDRNNFGPRIGFAYDVSGKGATVIRGGAGVYYDQPFYHGFTQRYLQGGLQAITRTVTLTAAQLAAAGLTFPNSFDYRTPFNQLSPFLSNAPRNLFLRGANLRSPYSTQISLGVQQKFPADFVFNADAVYNASRKQLLVFNLNAPSPFPRTAPGQTRSQTEANATRPFYNAATGTSIYQGVPVRDVLVSTNAGNAEYKALLLGVTKRFARRLSFVANYVFSSAIDSVTDDHLGANPNEWNDVVRAERAPSDFNQRHRFVAYGTFELPRGFELTGIATLASGLRINPVTGVDNNGDGNTVDRPVGFARNSFAGPAHKRLDATLLRKFALKNLNENARIELRAEVFNLFNNSNFYRFNNVYGNGAAPLATFAQPLSGISSVDPGRQIQFGARFVF
jgi:outer membrane receptor protein involved in Fe transport